MDASAFSGWARWWWLSFAVLVVGSCGAGYGCARIVDTVPWRVTVERTR
jgi:hypothetical protein